MVSSGRSQKEFDETRDFHWQMKTQIRLPAAQTILSAGDSFEKVKPAGTILGTDQAGSTIAPGATLRLLNDARVSLGSATENETVRMDQSEEKSRWMRTS